MDLSNLSSQELRQLKADVEKQLEFRAADDIKKGREQILEIARILGVPLEEIIGKQLHAPVKKTREPVPVRYRLGEDTWTGRGRKPKWLEKYLAGEGKTIEDLIV